MLEKKEKLYEYIHLWKKLSLIRAHFPNIQISKDSSILVM